MTSGLALALAAGCGGTVETGTGGNGGGSGGGGECAGFADATSTSSVTVRFQNNTFQPIYLPSQCTLMSYDITPIGGDDGVGYVFEGSCLQTCESLQTHGPILCGPCQEQTYRIEPGKTLETTWEGTGLKGGFTLPASCWAPGSPTGGTCSEIVAAAAGMYRVDAAGWSDCTGPCTCDASGVCQGSPTGLQAYPNPATFTFPSDTLVDVIFDTCAFGCAGSP